MAKKRENIQRGLETVKPGKKMFFTKIFKIILNTILDIKNI